MLTRLLRASLPAVLAGTFGLPVAHADMYTWVDASGTINVSNIAPPEDSGVTKVTHTISPPRDEAARASAQQAEVQALEARVGELESEIERARSAAPPPANYRMFPAPPMVQYLPEPAPPVQYVVNAAPAPFAGCDPAWMDCGLGWFPGIYAPGVIVLRAPGFRHFHPTQGGHHMAAQQPMRARLRPRAG